MYDSIREKYRIINYILSLDRVSTLVVERSDKKIDIFSLIKSLIMFDVKPILDQLRKSDNYPINDILSISQLYANPHTFDECDPDLMLNTPCSEYYSLCSFNKMLVNSDAKTFSILYCNIRKLSKNLNLLKELLCFLDSKVDILGITETKLGEKSISNVNIKG